MKKFIIGLVLGGLLSGTAVGLAHHTGNGTPWKITIEDSVFVRGKMISVTCTAWIYGTYLATDKSCEAY
jgi:hypothetical protein